ncbi:MAG TPA: SRPBCC family protein [Chryseosolibacter sp.]|nr:SRPBCC family protein [Chryseosolibacter sp.]
MDTTEYTTNRSIAAEASSLPPGTGSSEINIGSTERIISALGGAALTVMALRNLKSPAGVSMLLTGGFLLMRGVSGFCAVNHAIGRNSAHRLGSPVEVKTTVSVNRPRSEVYSFWRKLENLPRFMRHLEKVEELDQTRSRWTAKGPAGVGSVSWEAEILEDHQNEFISWSSLPGSTVDNAGEVRFIETPNGTDIKVQISYRLPAGDIGGVAAKLFSPMAEKMMRDDIRDLKKVMEADEVPVQGTSRKKNKKQEYLSGY